MSETMTEMGEIWCRKCPKCNKELIFHSKFACESSLNILPLCEACRTPLMPGQNRTKEIKKRSSRNKREIISDTDINFLAKRGNTWITKCPKCEKDVLHSNENNARTSIKRKRICRRCSGKVKVKENNPNFTFFDHKHNEETREKMCEIKKEWWSVDKEMKQLDMMKIVSGSCECYKKL